MLLRRGLGRSAVAGATCWCCALTARFSAAPLPACCCCDGAPPLLLPATLFSSAATDAFTKRCSAATSWRSTLPPLPPAAAALDDAAPAPPFRTRSMGVRGSERTDEQTKEVDANKRNEVRTWNSARVAREAGVRLRRRPGVDSALRDLGFALPHGELGGAVNVRQRDALDELKVRAEQALERERSSDALPLPDVRDALAAAFEELRERVGEERANKQKNI